MTRGLVIGKFYPPHAGHKHLIDTAAAGVDELTILVHSKDDQNIAPERRVEWLAKIHPHAIIKVIYSDDTVLADDDSKGWAQATIDLLGFVPDVVYSSEDYGPVYARYMGARHIMVDKERKTYPISGTQIRNNPLAHTSYLHPVVRAQFIKRICVLGAESSGTTTLALALAKHYNAPYVPEYGREFTEQKFAVFGTNYKWESSDFEAIATRQNELEDQVALQATNLLICDTNSLVTSIFHEAYMGRKSPKVASLAAHRKYDLYILTNIDFPFVQDGFRKDETVRNAMHTRFLTLLKNQNTPYFIVSGKVQERLQSSIKYIDTLLS